MESMGFNSVLGMGNAHNDSIVSLNRQIRFNNQQEINKHTNDITQAKAGVDNLNTNTNLSETIGEGVLGQVASKGKDFQAVGNVIKSAPKIGEAVLNTTEDLLFGKEQFAIQGVRDETAGTDLLNSAKTFLTDNVSKGLSIGDKASSIGKLGIVSTGLSVGMGLADGIQDLSAHKIVGDNTAERISNVAGIASGGLEAVGTALDLTGVGAPVGVALNLLGGLAGAVSGVSEVVGESEDKGTAVKNLQTVTNTPVSQEKLQSVSDIASSGAVVKSAN
jgi:hypothetical protein|tara:strand:- start:1068 stop:1895 length:828 start_codon:yes stop_codon:yes gene_type:complete